MNLYDIDDGSPTTTNQIKQCIEPFHLEFNENEFIMDSNMIQSGHKREPKQMLSSSILSPSTIQQQQQQQQQQLLNDANTRNKLIVGHTTTHNKYMRHRRAQTATGLIQNDLQFIQQRKDYQ